MNYHEFIALGVGQVLQHTRDNKVTLVVQITHPVVTDQSDEQHADITGIILWSSTDNTNIGRHTVLCSLHIGGWELM